MSVEQLSKMTEWITREMSSVRDNVKRGRYDSLAASDPEIWEHLFVDDIVPAVKKYQAEGGAQETAAFRALYAATKQVMDECLIPNELCEATSVLKHQIAPVLAAIGMKSAEVGSEIAADLRGISDESVRALFKNTAAKITKTGAPQAAFNAAALDRDAAGLAGKTVAFTGALSGMTRREAQAIAEALGAKVSGTVTKNTDLVIVGSDAGDKAVKAENLGVPIMTEAEWQRVTTPRTPDAAAKDQPDDGVKWNSASGRKFRLS